MHEVAVVIDDKVCGILWRDLFTKYRNKLEYIGFASYKDAYHQYLESAEWKSKREDILIRSYKDYTGRYPPVAGKGICEVCRVADATQVHHKTYKRIGDELPEDLVAICRNCHKSEHGLFAR